jgi:GAF domain-containing protein
VRHDYNKSVPKTKDLEVRLQRTEQQLQLFQKVSRLMVRELSLQEVLQGIVSLTVEFSQCDSCLVYLLDSDELVLCASNTPHPSTIGKIRLKLERRPDRLGGPRAAAVVHLAGGLQGPPFQDLSANCRRIPLKRSSRRR